MENLCNAIDSLAVADADAKDSLTGARDALSSFETIEDLGVFEWHTKPSAEFKNHKDVTEQEIRSRVNTTDPDIPRLSIGNIKLPTRLADGTKQLRKNRFPNDGGVAASLAAAAAKGVKKSDFDFVFGGSTLHMLAGQRNDRNVYLVQRAGSAIVVAKHSEYTADLGAKGYQFERLITGEPPDGTASSEVLTGMQLAKVGDFRVLFQAEVDAIDSRGGRVEAKSGNPGRFGEKEMFQMLSSRSGTLVYADCCGNTLQKIETRSLSQVADWTPESERRILEANILKSMAQLKVASVSEDFPSQLVFKNGDVVLESRRDLSILPMPDVVDALLSAPNAA